MEYIFNNEPSKYLHNINEDNFEKIALQVFNYQYNNNGIYNAFVNAIGANSAMVKRLNDIPFLPVSFFKTHSVFTGTPTPQTAMFSSSTTTSDIPGRHYVKDVGLYEENLLKAFRQFYGEPGEYAILALLPSYLQRKGASLVHMAQVLMDESKHSANGFYLDEFEKLNDVLNELEKQKQRVLLLGVTFALLDFAEAYNLNLNHTIVMETGGMKGMRRELTRGEVHEFLINKLGVQQIHSEYGMTELLSQAYAFHDGVFKSATTMKVLVRDINDPFDIRKSGVGCLNIIDLANVHSCAFIATDDMGRIYEDESFEVLGRVDNSALRGCNLMVV